MSTRTSTVALEVVADVDTAAAGLGRVETAAEGAAGALDKLQGITDAAGGGIDKVTTAADSLDAKGAAVTGAMGALASGLELVGASGAAETLNQIGMATDFLSGVGQVALIATEAQGMATKVLTGAQKALNLVMRANPIGLVVTAVLLLVAGFILAYQKSETFRTIVQAAGRVGAAAMGAVADAVGNVVTWVRDRLGPAFDVVKKIITVYLTPWRLAFDLVRDAISTVVDWAGKIPAAFDALKGKAESIGGALLSPFTAVKDALQWIADKIDGLKPPAWLSKLPGLPFGGDGRMALPTTTTTTVAAPTAGPSTVVQITVQGAVDPYSTAVQIRELLARYGVAVGVA